MKIKSVVTIGLLIISISCGQNDGQNRWTGSLAAKIPVAQDEHRDVSALRETLPTIATPVTLNSNRQISMTSVDPGDNELLIKLKTQTGFSAFGKIFATDKFTAILGYVPNDAGTPIVVTFDKTGQVITFHMLYETVMGDMGHYTANSVTIWPNRELHFIDSTVTRQINAEGDDEIPGTDSLTVTKKVYIITDAGTISQIPESGQP